MGRHIIHDWVNKSITVCCSCTYEDVQSTAHYLLEQTVHRPKIGIICGSGLGGLCDMLENTDVMAYETIPNFPMSTGESNSHPDSL